eukprot:TRINITY_DN2378_c0_g1_i1.p3 TRINITY_DN2378_c0_g1~~TRINITY_DN2378_c0_g1_i1.p3  ORF type:complete len:124 (+),score=32.65 TRINITY_DN2378_c0_g1_i1:111-482(+)
MSWHQLDRFAVAFRTRKPSTKAHVSVLLKSSSEIDGQRILSVRRKSHRSAWPPRPKPFTKVSPRPPPWQTTRSDLQSRGGRSVAIAPPAHSPHSIPTTDPPAAILATPTNLPAYSALIPLLRV